jgi:1-acyl-sn-glycerol-3-phosphate acyltransferase
MSRPSQGVNRARGLAANRGKPLIRTILMLAFWAIAMPIAALVAFPWTFLTGDISFLYRTFTWGALTGVRIAGVKIAIQGREKLDPKQSYIFMSNHTSNLDPPLLVPIIPGRTSVMAKKELFRYPILGRAMRMGSIVPVDRANRDAGIAAVRDAAEVLRKGIHMTIFVEGMRSFDGRLLPFKKGPFYLAMESGMPVVPVTINGTHEIMPKRRFSIQPGTATVIFHDPIPSTDFRDRDELMARVRKVINGALPPEYQEQSIKSTK